MTDPTAVMGRRIVAFLVDSLLLVVVLAAVVTPQFTSAAEKRTWPTESAATAHCNEVNSSLNDALNDRSDSGSSVSFKSGDRLCVHVAEVTYELNPSDTNQLSVTFYGVLAVVVLLNSCLLQGLTGASVGKWLLGLRVVKVDGSRAGLGWNLLRTVLMIVDAVICCFIIGLVTASSTKGHKRVGDMAASTFVVSKRAAGSPLTIPGVTPDAYGGQPYGGYPGQQYGGQYGGYPAQQYGQPGSPAAGGWGPPTDATQQYGTQATPGADGPTWDVARNAYIQYDREVSAWVQWDDNAKAWRPIDQ